MFDENAGIRSPSRRGVIPNESPLSPVSTPLQGASGRKRGLQNIESLDSSVRSARTKPSKTRKLARTQGSDVEGSSNSNDIASTLKSGRSVAIGSDWPKKKGKTTRKSVQQPAVPSSDPDYEIEAGNNDSGEDEALDAGTVLVAQPRRTQARSLKRAHSTLSNHEGSQEATELPKKRGRRANAINDSQGHSDTTALAIKHFPTATAKTLADHLDKLELNSPTRATDQSLLPPNQPKIHLRDTRFRQLATVLHQKDIQATKELLSATKGEIEPEEYLRSRAQETAAAREETSTLVEEGGSDGETARNELDDLLDEKETTLHLAMRNPEILRSLIDSAPTHVARGILTFAILLYQEHIPRST